MTGSSSCRGVVVIEAETVTCRPTRNSMVPLIHSRHELIISQVDPTRVEVGDNFSRTWPENLLVSSRPLSLSTRVQIGNNRGSIDGWIGFDRVYGIAVSVAGTDFPGGRARRSFRGIRRNSRILSELNVWGHSRGNREGAVSTSR